MSNDPMYDATLAAVLRRARHEATQAVVGADARVLQAERALRQGLAAAERRVEEAEHRAALIERQAHASSEPAPRSRQAQDLADGVTRAAPTVPDMDDLLAQAAPLTRHLDALFGRSARCSEE